VKKPKPLSISQLAALDHLVGVGGEAYAGNGMFRSPTAKPLLRRKCIEKLSTGDKLYLKYRVTEHGRAERARAHERLAAA
jgi:hypothetical protein